MCSDGSGKAVGHSYLKKGDYDKFSALVGALRKAAIKAFIRQ